MNTRTSLSGATGLQTRGLSPARQHNKSRWIPATAGMTGFHVPESNFCHPGESRDPVSSSVPKYKSKAQGSKDPWHQGLALGFTVMAAALLLTSNAHAIGLGARAGMSLEPDQFVLGGQAMVGQVFPMIELAPGFDVGFGNDISTAIINVDFRFNLPSLPKVSPNIYVGAGPAYVTAEPDGGKRDSEIAASIFAGMRIPFSPVSSYNLEARFGLGDYPDMKFMFGVLFGL